jgi:hypothetical protein
MEEPTQKLHFIFKRNLDKEGDNIEPDEDFIRYKKAFRVLHMVREVYPEVIPLDVG